MRSKVFFAKPANRTALRGSSLFAAAAGIALSVAALQPANAETAAPWVIPASLADPAVPAPAVADQAAADSTIDPTIDPGADPVNTKLVMPVIPQPPQVLAQIDLSDQTMSIFVGDELKYTFKVSTGRRGYGTPTGAWQAEWLSRFHRSKKYHYAPMPWSVFFHGGYAVHGTTEVRNLGRPASHGCVRLHPDNAKIFYQLVQATGKANSRVAIVQ